MTSILAENESIAGWLFSVYDDKGIMPTSSAKKNQPAVVNIASVPHRSPFRYPGGKTWLVPRIREWLNSLQPRPRELAEPFAGGAIVGLSALFESHVDKLILVEKDEDVAAVWNVIIYGEGKRLAQEIIEFELTEARVRSFLAKESSTDFARAFATILRNRVQRGGILAPGASFIKNGENGKGIRSRWYPETLRKRIEAILHIRSNIAFIKGDGIEFIRYNGCRPDTAFFVDPPYTVAGRRLYKYSDIDHEELFDVLSGVRGDFLMTYDDCPEIVNLAAKNGFDCERVRMKNTHHEIMSELLVGRDLSWARRRLTRTSP